MRGSRSIMRLFLAVSGLLVLASGCASMYSPGTDDITISTIPEGAKVYDGVNVLGTTPFKHTFKRETLVRKTLTLRKEGYESQDLVLGTTLDKMAFWNFAFFPTTCGVTSWGIDAANGNMVKYTPDSYLIDLKKEGAASSPKEQTEFRRLRFVAVNQDRLQRDIAWGDGEYLRAYFEFRLHAGSHGEYQDFRNRVSREAPALLSLHDPVAFFQTLEVL
jgi:hypothetical protein